MTKFLAIAVVAFSTVAYAQEPPLGEGAWVMRVVTSGGLIGSARGNFTIASDGQLTCSRPGCAPMLAEARVRQIGEMISAIDAAAWVRQPKSTCSDCFETVLTLRRREGKNVSVLVAQWDESQPVAAQLRRLSEAVILLGGEAVR